MLSGSLPVSLAQVAQYLATILVFVLSLCFWQAPRQYVDNALAMACSALIGVLVAGALIQGFHDYRWVGLIHPNHYARYAYVALVLHSIVMRRVSLFATLLAFSAAYMVSARTILIGILLFYIGYTLLAARGISADLRHQQIRANSLAWQLIAAALTIISIFMLADSDALLERFSNDFAVFDAERGIMSGFTGRSSSWTGFFETMPDFVLYGYGFRSGRYELHTVHSGILSYFMDFGLILGGALLAAVLARTIYLIVKGRSSHNHTMLICGLALFTTLVIQYFEPDNFNIGFIGSLFFMVILAYAPQRQPRLAVQRSRVLHGSRSSMLETSQTVFRK
jgi:mannose/fructose/N-acetylgalactosamine-specific phosphotransferase system component IID